MSGIRRLHIVGQGLTFCFAVAAAVLVTAAVRGQFVTDTLCVGRAGDGISWFSGRCLTADSGGGVVRLTLSISTATEDDIQVVGRYPLPPAWTRSWTTLPISSLGGLWVAPSLQGLSSSRYGMPPLVTADLVHGTTQFRTEQSDGPGWRILLPQGLTLSQPVTVTDKRYILTFNAWLIAAILAVAPATSLMRWRQQRKRLAHGQCVVCGYDLRATPSRCPECGA